jgi:hypothetical protein
MQEDSAGVTRKEIGDAYVAKLSEFESVTAAARDALANHPELLGNVENARNAIKQARSRAMKKARKDPRPPQTLEEYGIAEGFKAKGRSSYYNKEGELGGVWILEREDAEKQREILEEALAALSQDLPRVAPIPAPEHGIESLCNLYTLTDCHLGMMASASEAGEDWGLDKGEEIIGKGFDWLIKGAPKARKCVISQLGDFLHSEGLESLTSRSKHSLDQDARLGDIVRAAIRLLRRVVDSALSVHEEVELVVAEGNHDEAASIILRESFKVIYEREQRLTVLDGVGGGDLPFYETTHGDTMLGFHHGHIRNVKSKGAAQGLALLFANGEAWRTTRKRYIHTGHHHDEALIEVTGAKCFAHPSFIVPDAYASRNFGGAMRHMTAHTYHAEHGKVGENTVTPEMLG